MKKNYVTRSIRVGSDTLEKKSLLGGKKEVECPEYCAMSRLSKKIDDVCNDLYCDEYEVISITPIIRGDWGSVSDGGCGFSVTDGVIITAKLISSNNRIIEK